MGSWVSASFGYGIALPNAEEDEEEYTPSEWVKSVQPSWSDPDDGVDWDTTAEALGLHFDMGYVHDYGGQGVIFGSKPVSASDTVKSFTQAEVADAILAFDEKLKDAAEKIGIPFKPAYFLVVSYG